MLALQRLAPSLELIITSFNHSNHMKSKQLKQLQQSFEHLITVVEQQVKQQSQQPAKQQTKVTTQQQDQLLSTQQDNHHGEKGISADHYTTVCEILDYLKISVKQLQLSEDDSQLNAEIVDLVYWLNYLVSNYQQLSNNIISLTAQAIEFMHELLQNRSDYQIDLEAFTNALLASTKLQDNKTAHQLTNQETDKTYKRLTSQHTSQLDNQPNYHQSNQQATDTANSSLSINYNNNQPSSQQTSWSHNLTTLGHTNQESSLDEQNCDSDTFSNKPSLSQVATTLSNLPHAFAEYVKKLTAEQLCYVSQQLKDNRNTASVNSIITSWLKSLLSLVTTTRQSHSDKLYVAFSGGADSTFLLVQSWLLQLPTIGVYFEHGLQEKSKLWLHWCKAFTLLQQQLQPALFPHIQTLTANSSIEQSSHTISLENNLEAKARQQRYQAIFSYIVSDMVASSTYLGLANQDEQVIATSISPTNSNIDKNIENNTSLHNSLSYSSYYHKPCLLIGHHLGDYQEQYFLNLQRGAAGEKLHQPLRTQQQQLMRGSLNGIPVTGTIDLLRPYLEISKEEITTLLHYLQIPYLEDPMNQDQEFSRVVWRNILNNNPLLGNGLATSLVLQQQEDQLSNSLLIKQLQQLDLSPSPLCSLDELLPQHTNAVARCNQSDLINQSNQVNQATSTTVQSNITKTQIIKPTAQLNNRTTEFYQQQSQTNRNFYCLDIKKLIAINDELGIYALVKTVNTFLDYWQLRKLTVNQVTELLNNVCKADVAKAPRLSFKYKDIYSFSQCFYRHKNYLYVHVEFEEEGAANSLNGDNSLDNKAIENDFCNDNYLNGIAVVKSNKTTNSIKNNDSIASNDRLSTSPNNATVGNNNSFECSNNSLAKTSNSATHVSSVTYCYSEGIHIWQLPAELQQSLNCNLLLWCDQAILNLEAELYHRKKAIDASSSIIKQLEQYFLQLDLAGKLQQKSTASLNSYTKTNMNMNMSTNSNSSSYSYACSITNTHPNVVSINNPDASCLENNQLKQLWQLLRWCIQQNYHFYRATSHQDLVSETNCYQLGVTLASAVANNHQVQDIPSKQHQSKQHAVQQLNRPADFTPSKSYTTWCNQQRILKPMHQRLYKLYLDSIKL